MSPKTALIFGCSGQDGSLLSKLLIQKGLKVVGISRKQQSQKNNLQRLGIADDIEHLKGDILDNELIRNLLESYSPDEVYNLAAQSSVGKSYNLPRQTLDGIITGTLNLLESAKSMNFSGSMFFAGSSEMFGSTKNRATINSPQMPLSPYAVAKQASFNLVRIYRDSYHLKCFTGVLFNHESELRNDNFVTHKIINAAIECSRDKTTKITLGNINIQRDWGWAEEYVEAMKIITSSKLNEDFVICTGKTTKLEKIIDLAFKKFNLTWQDHIQIDKNLFRKQEIEKSVGDPEYLKKALNWEARLNIEEIVDNLIDKKLNN